MIGLSESKALQFLRGAEKDGPGDHKVGLFSYSMVFSYNWLFHFFFSVGAQGRVSSLAASSRGPNST